MSNFNIGNITAKHCTINLSNGEKLNIAKLDIELNGKKIAKGKMVSMTIEEGVLKIKTQ